MIVFILLLYGTLLPVHSKLENLLCSLSKSEKIFLGHVPRVFEFSLPYTITLASNQSRLLSYVTFELEPSLKTNNSSICQPTNQSSSVHKHKSDLVMKFERNMTNSKCVQLKLRYFLLKNEWHLIELCSNSSTDKVIDNDDKYDVQPYMRTINTTEVALFDNFNWLIFGSPVQQIWETHEGMRLSRDCDAAEDGRVATFSNPRGKRRLISRPIDISNVTLLHMRLGSGTCSPPAPTDPPLQLLVNPDCKSSSQWRLVYSQKILPGIESITVPFVIRNVTNSSTVCLKLEQAGDRFAGSGSWFMDDFSLVRFREHDQFFFDTFSAMRPGNWFRLSGGNLKTCHDRMSMVFEWNADIRTELGATTIDFPLSENIDYEQDAIFHLSKNKSIDWTTWNATGFFDLNATCTEDDAITFNGENFRQLCSPIVELTRIDSVRFTLSAEPCTKRTKSIPNPNVVIFLSVLYNGSTVGYSRTIRRILLRDLQSAHKTFDVRTDEIRHSAQTFGRVCLSQYHQSSEKNADVWSVRDFLALPLLPRNITHYIQLNINTKCSEQPANNGINQPNIQIEYSLDYGKTWQDLLHPCYLDSSCSRDAQHVYSSQIVLSTSDWHRITLPLPMATLQHDHIRFRIGVPSGSMSTYPVHESWAIEKVFIGQCYRACSGHGWCQYNACRCDPGFLGDFCQISNSTLLDRASYLFEQNIPNQSDLMMYHGGRFNYKCNIISQGKALVFSKADIRFIRLSNINGSSPKLLEFTLRLGGANSQCFGTSPNDLSRKKKSILLLSSCSNGVQWTIVDRFHIDDIQAPEFGTISRIVFDQKPGNENCLIEWRQMAHGGDNQDVWAIDDITIRNVPVVKRNLTAKSFQTKLTYIRPGYILSFQIAWSNPKEVPSTIDLNEIRIRINFTQIDLAHYSSLVSYHSDNLTMTFVLSLPRSIWYEYVLINLTLVTTKKCHFNAVHLGVQCENNCWLQGMCLEGVCSPSSLKKFDQSSTIPSFDENDLHTYKINVIDTEYLLPFLDSTKLTAVHFQTLAGTTKKTNLTWECSPNGGIQWIELGQSIGETEKFLKDHYVALPTLCRTNRTLFRWKNASIKLVNIAFVQAQIQNYFMEQCQAVDLSKWLYPTYSINASGLYPNKIANGLPKQTIFQLISTAITLKEHDYILMIDIDWNTKTIDFQIDYSLDNVTWHSLADSNAFLISKHRFGFDIPKRLLRRSIRLRLQSSHPFLLHHIYLGPPCPANCYGHGRCIWRKEQAICKCDQNQTSDTHCLSTNHLLSSIYETFENPLNTSNWTMSSQAQVTHRCYNRLSKTTPYLCFLPHNQTERAYAMIGPFQTIRYVSFKFGLQYVGIHTCSNQILFQYSYDNGIQWSTKVVLDETKNFFETFDDLPINKNFYLRWIEETDHSCLMWNLRSITIRTRNDSVLWFEQKNKSVWEMQTWEYSSLPMGALLQFELQMFPMNKNNRTDWELSMEFSTDIHGGWSFWTQLTPPCNQSNLYCEDHLNFDGSTFLASLFLEPKNVMIPIPDICSFHDVRFVWVADQPDAKFVIDKVYVGADCPWFCSGHGTCQKNGCQCYPGYVLPFCSPDPSIRTKKQPLPVELDANLSSWSVFWGYEKCSINDDRFVFSKPGTRGLISPEISLMGIKYLRIQLDTCANRSGDFSDPILVQYSLNNGVLWRTLAKLSLRPDLFSNPWLVELPKEDAIQVHLVRLRLFQRAMTTASSWILNAFEMIPEKLPQRWFASSASLTPRCYPKNATFPREVYSSVDIELNQTSFLTFQLDWNNCTKNIPTILNQSPFDLEYSMDYGRHWVSIYRIPSTVSNVNDVVIAQPIEEVKKVFYVPLNTFYPLTKFLRIRWIASMVSIANRWFIHNVTVRSECEAMCEVDPCHGKCVCPQTKNCPLVSTRKRTFFERLLSVKEFIFLPALNLLSTKFLEFHIQTTCKNDRSLNLSLEYSSNLGLTWRLFRYFTFSANETSIIHEDFIDEMNDDNILIRFVFPSDVPSCVRLEQVSVSGSRLVQDTIYMKFDKSTNFDSTLFVSLGDGKLNGSYLIFSVDQSNTTIHEIITDDLLIMNNSIFVQLALVPLSPNQCCLNLFFSFSSDYGFSWQSIDYEETLLFPDEQNQHTKIFTWKFPSIIIGANEVRLRLRFENPSGTSDDKPFHLGIAEFYLGSNCINACHGHGMCIGTRQCRCLPGWANRDCSLSLVNSPHEIDILTEQFYTTEGARQDNLVFNNTCKRVFVTNYLDVHHEHTFVYVELSDTVMPKNLMRRNGDGWIRLQYREINAHQWLTLHIFKGAQLKFTQLLPPVLLQLRLIQDPPMNGRSPWTIEQFHIFHLHSQLQWSIDNETHWNATFLTLKQSDDEIIYQTKDVYYHLNFTLQFEYNCSNITEASVQYSIDLGLTWLSIFDDHQLQINAIRVNPTSSRLTIPFQTFTEHNDSIRFRLTVPSSCPLHYLYVGGPCPMNCYGQARCQNGQCLFSHAISPLGDFRETFEKDFQETHWLQFGPYRQETHRIMWTTRDRQAITRPIDLRPLKAIKWIYHLEKVPKTCLTSIYFLFSTDGTLTWTILHRLDLPTKTITQSNSSLELSVELPSNDHVGQFQWFQSSSSTCHSFTWGLSRIISVKALNIYFLTDYFYTISSSRSNWESIEGALLAQPDQCNNDLPSLIFHETEFSAVTVPILIQSDYVLVFQFNIECNQNENVKKLQCRNLTSTVEYRSDSTNKWIKLADMSDVACRTSLMNGGYFKMHSIKLPSDAFSSGTQFRWFGTQANDVRWSMHSLFIGECPAYCHDRGICSITGCQCTAQYTGTSCETYIGKESLPTWFNETFDDSSAAIAQGSSSNNWIKLTGDGHIRHVCDEKSKNNTKHHLNGQALHFGPGCGCGNVEAITRELNVSQAKSVSFAFHVTMEDNCVLTTKNVSVALEWTYDEGISWSRLLTMYNQRNPQFFNLTLPNEMILTVKKRPIGGVRFRWTQVEHATTDVYWAIDNIRVK